MYNMALVLYDWADWANKWVTCWYQRNHLGQLHVGLVCAWVSLIHILYTPPPLKSFTEADPGFPNRGGAKDYVHPVHITSAKRQGLYGRATGTA